MSKKVYIGGKVTGEDYQRCSKKFQATEDILEGLGFEVTNPMKLVPEGHSWKKAMKILIPALRAAEILFLLPDWKESEGAKLEFYLAQRYNIEVVFYEQINEMQWNS